MTLPADAQTWDQRRWFLMAFAAALLANIALISGGALSAVAACLLSNVWLLLLWIGACAGWGCLVAKFLLPDNESCSSRLGSVTALAMGFGVVGLVVQVLGLAALETRGTAIGVLVLGWIPLLWGTRFLQSAAIGEWLRGRCGFAWWLLVLVPVAGTGIVAATVSPGLLWSGADPSGFDVLEYHLQVPREWFEAGAVVPLKHNVFSFTPMLVESHYLLAMLLRGSPWKGMYLAQFMHLTMCGALVVSVYAAMRRASRGQAVVAAALVGTAPWIMLLGSVAYNECGMLAFGTLAVTWTLRSIESTRRTRCMAVAGLMLGFACGAKLSAGFLVVALPLSLLWSAEAGRTRAGAGFVVAFLLSISPWLIRNIAWSGNPLFPEATSIFGTAHFNSQQVQRWRASLRPREDQRDVVSRLSAVRSQIVTDWRYGYLLLPLALVSACVSWKRRSAMLMLTFGILSIFWVWFTHLQSRFFVMSIPIAALLIAQEGWARNAVVLAAMMSVIGAVRMNELLGVRLVAAGIEDFTPFISERLDPLLFEGNLALVGDARAFLYQIPMSRLRYRTVFDVGAGSDLVDGWLNDEHPPRELIWVDPGELRRYSRTYKGLPPPPSDLPTEPAFLH